MGSITAGSAAQRRIGTQRPWALPAGQVAADLGTDPVTGLPEAEAASRLACFGENVLVEQGGKSTWRLLAEQFANTMIVVLVVAAAVAGGARRPQGHRGHPGHRGPQRLLGFVQEYRAEQAMAALKAMTAPVARVRRGGQRSGTVRRPRLVPGDLVLLGPGDLLAADLRLTECVGAAGQRGRPDRRVQASDQAGRASAGGIDGSLVANGATWRSGHGRHLRPRRRGGGRDRDGDRVGPARRPAAGPTRRADAAPAPARRRSAGGWPWRRWSVCAVVFVAGVARGEPVERMFLTAVSLAVAAIPEGLPAVVTIALALGAQAHGRPARAGPPAAGGRDARLGHGHLHGQDRHPHPEPHGGRAGLDPGGRVPGHRRRATRRSAPSCRRPARGANPRPSWTASARWPRPATTRRCSRPTRLAGTGTLTGDPTEAALLALAGEARRRPRRARARDRPRCAEVGVRRQPRGA